MSQNENELRAFNIIVLGAEKSGKTSIISRFTKDEFNDTYHPSNAGLSTAAKEFPLDGQQVRMNMWDLPADTVVNPKFAHLLPAYLRSAHAVLYVYDVSSFESYKQIEGIREIVTKHFKNSPIQILVGNKIDLRPAKPKEGDEIQPSTEPSETEIEAYLQGRFHFHSEVSSKTYQGDTIKKMFEVLAKELLNTYPADEPVTPMKPTEVKPTPKPIEQAPNHEALLKKLRSHHDGLKAGQCCGGFFTATRTKAELQGLENLIGHIDRGGDPKEGADQFPSIKMGEKTATLLAEIKTTTSATTKPDL